MPYAFLPPSAYWFFYQNRFAEALSRCPQGKREGATLVQYARYRLGLYQSAAQTVSDRNWRTALASLVALAACGRAQEATELARNIVQTKKFKRHRAALADALAPYLPALAQELLEGHAALPTLQAALLLKLGKVARATHVLDQTFFTQGTRVQPELHLLQSNADPVSPARQIDCLNAFLGAYALTPVMLCDTALPPGSRNITSALASKPVPGPLVSVLMTAFRAGSRIGAALESLLAQTYRNIEIIVIDDASDDHTADVVQALATRDARIKYLRLPVNVGTYVAKNIGLQHAAAEFVTCHDADDWAHPARIERQIRPLLDDNRLVCTTSQWIRMQDDGRYFARPVHPLMRLNPASPLFRKSVVVRHAGIWDCVRTGADSEFHARLKLVFGRRAIRRIAAPLTIGAHHPESLMNAAETGYDAQGMSPTRLAYWESWSHWHINTLRRGDRPTLSEDMLSARCFEAPSSITVAPDAIAHCLKVVGV